MKYPMHLILDSYSHPGISLFWKRHGLSIMEQLVPNEFFLTTGDTPLEKLIEREIWSGWKKIILIGNPNSIRRGFNTLMQASRECRSTLEIGFWPLNLQNLAACISQSSLYLKSFLQVFKVGHTLHVDVMKVQFMAPELETRYFWNEFEIKSTLPNAESAILIDAQNSALSGKFSCRIAFHDETLSSLTMHPGKLTRAPIIKVYLKREHTLTAAERFKQLSNWLAVESKTRKKEKLLKTGKQVEINGNWANLDLKVEAIQDSVQSVHIEVERKAFSLIIPSKPIQSTENIRSIIPGFRPREVITSNRGVTKEILLNLEEKPQYKSK